MEYFWTKQSWEDFITKLYFVLIITIILSKLTSKYQFKESIHATNLCSQSVKFPHINLNFTKINLEHFDTLSVFQPPLLLWFSILMLLQL